MLPPFDTDLSSFDVSPQNGFLPDELPLKRLSDPYYDSWEAIISHISSLLKSRNLRQTVKALPILSTSRLTSQREWQRAYLILSYMTHAHIWEAGGPSQILPPSISIPFLEISSRMELPPTATYAAFNLWNFTTLSSEPDWSCLENLRILHTFTGTRDEEWFYIISVAIEGHGAKSIPMMLRAMDAVRDNEPRFVLSALMGLAGCIREIGQILKRMDEHCSPNAFYNEIRPFLAGSKDMQLAGLPRGVFYDEGDGKGDWRQYSGGSNAQSSLIQFFDVVLDVKHISSTGSEGFLRGMRNYMPGPHSRFLQHIESKANIRSYVERTSDSELTAAYNLAVDELKKFRDIHIQIVTRYIIRPSRQRSQSGNKGLNIAVASSKLTETEELQGTGGTELLPFLKRSRDETKGASLV